ncbi:MAG: YcgL domain-containing protein [Chromatocurvus sp.]
MRRVIEIFASSRREGMYLYTRREQVWNELPGPLRQAFGDPRRVMTLMLTPERRLARASAAEVIAAIDDKGFFLQMPPAYSDAVMRQPDE